MLNNILRFWFLLLGLIFNIVSLEATESLKNLETDVVFNEQGSRKVVVGLYVNRIDSFDIKTGKAVLDFWYWSIQEGTKESMLEGLELANGTLEPLLSEVICEESGPYYYETMRYRGTVQCLLQLGKFPFDQQRIELCFEDADRTSEVVVFQPDVRNSRLDPTCRINGWDIKNVIFSQMSHLYPTSYGSVLSSKDGTEYSCFKTTIVISRSGGAFQKVIKYFWSLFICVAVGLFAVLIPLKAQDSRFTMSVGALFACVGCSYVVIEKLPDSPDLTYAEIFSHVSLGVVAIVLLESIISLYFFTHKYEKLSMLIDRFFFGCVGVSYLLLIVYISCFN